ncbi:spore coat associated protein CotJA [Clostridium homopropionicum]|nr:spore coat associated protein CotJA [Clostridium homopropionicum]
MGELELVRAYVVRQPYTGLFPLSEALHKGTIFPNLYMPYPGK